VGNRWPSVLHCILFGSMYFKNSQMKPVLLGQSVSAAQECQTMQPMASHLLQMQKW
jgi:hypothetical protein